MVRLTMRLFGGAALGLMCAIPLVGRAQTPSPQGLPPGSVPTPEQLQLKPLPAQPDASQLPAAPPIPRELGKPADEITLDVTAYAVDPSAAEALRSALPALTAPFVGKARSYEDLVNAAAACYELAVYYRKQAQPEPAQ